MTNHKDYESPAHESDICIIYFILFFNVFFFFDLMLQIILYSVLLLITILFLLFTVQFYNKDLGMIVFLYLHVNSINIKGSFFNKFFIKCCTCPHVLMSFCPLLLLLLFISVILLMLSGDIETNPGPDPGYLSSFSFCHWNLNSITAHNFIKMSLLQAYNTINRFDIICLSETYLDNSYHTDDDQLTFPGYNLIRADNPNNIKRGGVCIYHQDSLSVKVINLNILNECLVCEVSLGSQRVCLVSIYWTPSQSNNEYDTFLLNFEQLLTYLNSIKLLKKNKLYGPVFYGWGSTASRLQPL